MDIRKQIQNSLSYLDDCYTLKTDDQLLDIISNFGCGETEFHTADIECLIKEKQQLQQNQYKLIEALNLFTEYKETYGEKPFYPIPHVKVKIACEIMKEVCGGSNKE